MYSRGEVDLFALDGDAVHSRQHLSQFRGGCNEHLGHLTRERHESYSIFWVRLSFCAAEQVDRVRLRRDAARRVVPVAHELAVIEAHERGLEHHGGTRGKWGGREDEDEESNNRKGRAPRTPAPGY